MTHKRSRKPYLITSDVAVILKCSVDEVRRLETDGEIVAVRTRGRHRHFDPASVEAYRRRRTAPHRKSVPGKAERDRPPRRPTARGEPMPSELDEILDEEEALRALAEEQAPPPPLPPPTILDHARLSVLRMHGTLCIPFDIPPEWHEKATHDLWERIERKLDDQSRTFGRPVLLGSEVPRHGGQRVAVERVPRGEVRYHTADDDDRLGSDAAGIDVREREPHVPRIRVSDV